METGALAQATINILEGNGNILDRILDPITSSEGIFGAILHNPIRLGLAVIIFLFRIIALIWTIKDINSRSSSLGFQFLSAIIVIILGPIFGTLLYIAIRPQGRKWDKTPRRDVVFCNVEMCDSCGYVNKIENMYCVNCGEYLHTSCRECKNKHSKSYSYCPNCGAPNLPE